jgi:hypothetical protein
VSYDPVDIWGGALGSIFKQLLLFVSAVWVGCLIGGIALLPGSLIVSGTVSERFLKMILISPMFLFSLWGAFNVLLLLGALAFFIRSENASYGAWMIFAGIESLIVMLGWAKDFPGWLAQSAMWVSWVITLSMAVAGVLLLRQWQSNRFAHHLAVIAAENAAKRAAKEMNDQISLSREGPSR